MKPSKKANHKQRPPSKISNKVKNAALKEVDKASVRQEYEKVFSGFSMKLPANEIPKLLAVDGVKAVYPDVTYKTDEVKKASSFQTKMSPRLWIKALHLSVHQSMGCRLFWKRGQSRSH